MRWLLLSLPGGRHLDEIAEGVIEYARAGPDWSIHYVEQAPEAAPWVAEFDWAGAITSRPDHPLIRRLRRRKRPVVVVEHDPTAGLPLVRGDDEAVGQLAFEHLRGLGLKRFAYWGTDAAYAVRRRGEGFLGRALAEGFEVYAVRGSRYAGHSAVVGDHEDMPGWLAALPKPVGLFAHFIVEARRAAVHCAEQGIRVPEEVAILGVDNDPLACRANNPALSAVDQGCRRVGHLAARTIDRLWQGRRAPAEPILVPPAGVVQRRSTDSFAVEDPFAAAAMRFIRDRLHRRIGVPDVVAVAGLSRRALEQRFKKATGRTVHQEIVRARVEHARRLLSQTHLPLGTVARRCGFRCHPEFSRVFKRQTGLPPQTYRRRRQGLE